LPGLAQYDDAWSYSLPGHLGSLKQLIDPTGQMLLTQNYDPFGNVLAQTGPGASIFGYTGEQTDPTGLVFLRARYYDPAIGRFLTADSLIPDPLRSQAWTRYAYVENNSVNFIDPSGHCIVQWSGEVRMGQAPYGTSGLCPHTESPHREAAYAATAMHNAPVNNPPAIYSERFKEQYRAYMRSLLPEAWRDTYDTMCYYSDIFELMAAIGSMAGPLRGGGLRPGGIPRNPFGKPGGPAHLQLIDDIVNDLRVMYADNPNIRIQTEYRIYTPYGQRAYRVVDVAAIDQTTGRPVSLHQIGVQEGGLPVPREIQAMDDIGTATGIRPQFHNYNWEGY
jgi:RHS repeat-associated protein